VGGKKRRWGVAIDNSLLKEQKQRSGGSIVRNGERDILSRKARRPRGEKKRFQFSGWAEEALNGKRGRGGNLTITHPGFRAQEIRVL